MNDADIAGAGPETPHRSARTRTPALHRTCDLLTELLLYAMVVFSPWAFGTTESWSIWIMNAGSYALGVLLALKWFTRWRYRWQPERWGTDSHAAPAGGPAARETSALRAHRWLTSLLAGLTLLILVYTLVSALNARVLYVWIDGQKAAQYVDCIRWLPHSYNQIATWFAFWQYLGFACAFWAVRDWLLTRTRGDRDTERADSWLSADQRGAHLPPLPHRWRRLLWLLCLNGALLALVSIFQRLDRSNKLLWLVEPHLNRTYELQFGPYAYRSNAAQYFNLLWPLCLAFWWHASHSFQGSLRGGSRAGSGPHLILLPCAILLAACPLISTSRGGAAVGLATFFPAAALLWLAGGGRQILRLAILACAIVTLALGGALGWQTLRPRLQGLLDENMSGRKEIYETAAQIAGDYRWLGTGPGTFGTVYEYYRKTAEQASQSYLHNDWLEFRVTYGRLGFALILAAFGCLAAIWICGAGCPQPWWFPALLGLSVAGCLAHARFDFPLQIHSLTFLFLIVCGLLSASGRAGKSRS